MPKYSSKTTGQNDEDNIYMDALLPIAPLPKKPEEYEFKVYGDESYKQQIAK